MPSTCKVFIIAGTRPEAIKLAPVIFELRKRAKLECSLCSTGQQNQMLDQALRAFGLTPDIELRVMTPSQTLASLTSRLSDALGSLFADRRPDLVLVQGDTTTAFVGALAAYYQRIAVAHVEAGSATDDKFAPFPEEVNRRFVGQIADWHFPPTENARQNLLAERVPDDRILVTGNTVIDALFWMRERLITQGHSLISEFTPYLQGVKRMVLVTGHRRESFGESFRSICRSIRHVADREPDTVFVYPVHLNPNVREPVNKILGGHPRILLLEPVDYTGLVWLLDRCHIVLTDSGGIQEEAPSFGKPVLVMRETTERPESVEAGNARLVGVSEDRITSGLDALLHDDSLYSKMSQARNLYGDGHAAYRIAQFIEQHT